jgi:hypothetical protein
MGINIRSPILVNRINLDQIDTCCFNLTDYLAVHTFAPLEISVDHALIRTNHLHHLATI